MLDFDGEKTWSLNGLSLPTLWRWDPTKWGKHWGCSGTSCHVKCQLARCSLCGMDSWMRSSIEGVSTSALLLMLWAGQPLFLWVCPVHCRIWNSIPGLYLLAANSTSFLQYWQPNTSLDITKHPLSETKSLIIHPWRVILLLINSRGLKIGYQNIQRKDQNIYRDSPAIYFRDKFQELCSQWKELKYTLYSCVRLLVANITNFMYGACYGTGL